MDKKNKKELRFKEQYTFEERRRKAIRRMDIDPNICPTIVEKADNDENLNDIGTLRLLVPKTETRIDKNTGAKITSDNTFAKLQARIRKRVNLKDSEALFCFINNTFAMQSTTIRQLYNDHADDDGFLYVQYAGENVFGTGAPVNPPPFSK